MGVRTGFKTFIGGTLTLGSTAFAQALTVTLPADIIAGDIIMVFVAAADVNSATPPTITNPTGYTQITTVSCYATAALDAYAGLVTYKISNGTEASTSLTVTSGTNTASRIGVQIIRPSAGLGGWAAAVVGINGNTGTAAIPPSQTVPSITSLPTLVVGFAQSVSGTAAITPSVGDTAFVSNSFADSSNADFARRYVILDGYTSVTMNYTGTTGTCCDLATFIFYPTTGITNPSQDIGQRFITKDYLLDVYPNIASNAGTRTSPGLWVWGVNTNGGIGDGTTVSYSSPIQVGALNNWKQIAAGGSNSTNVYSGAIRTDGSLWAWGYNFNGQLGDGTTVNKSSPIQIGTLTNWKQVYCAYASSAYSGAVKTDGTLWAWGYNGAGNLGDGTILNKSSPVQIGTLTNWKQIICGYSTSSIAIKTDGTLWAWGYNGNGSLGDGTTVNKSSPIQIGTLTNWKQITCGSSSGSVSAIKTDGTLWAWGYNGAGNLGDGTTTSYSSPIQIGTLSNWKKVYYGSVNGFAIKTDGTLWGWGTNVNGQLGQGTTINTSSPTQVGSLTNWKSIVNAGSNCLATKTDGTLWGWGANGASLGDGTTVNKSSPVQIGSLTNWKLVSISPGHALAIQDASI